MLPARGRVPAVLAVAAAKYASALEVLLFDRDRATVTVVVAPVPPDAAVAGDGAARNLGQMGAPLGEGGAGRGLEEVGSGRSGVASAPPFDPLASNGGGGGDADDDDDDGTGGSGGGDDDGSGGRGNHSPRVCFLRRSIAFANCSAVRIPLSRKRYNSRMVSGEPGGLISGPDHIIPWTLPALGGVARGPGPPSDFCAEDRYVWLLPRKES